MAISLQHQTPAQFAARLRARFKGATKAEAARIATWILDHLEAGDFTDAQLRNAWNLSAAQWTALKSRLTALRTAYRAVDGAAGE